MSNKSKKLRHSDNSTTTTTNTTTTTTTTTNIKPNEMTIEERKAATMRIIKQLKDLDLNISHPPIKKLFGFLKKYNDDGIRQVINIPFPDVNRRIKGLLSPSIREDTHIMFKYEKFD